MTHRSDSVGRSASPRGAQIGRLEPDSVTVEPRVRITAQGFCHWYGPERKC